MFNQIRNCQLLLILKGWVSLPKLYETFDGQGGRPVFHHYSDIMLQNSTIEKILGRKISYSESPVEIKDEE